mgnify:CR=1 FL=1
MTLGERIWCVENHIKFLLMLILENMVEKNLIFSLFDDKIIELENFKLVI